MWHGFGLSGEHPGQLLFNLRLSPDYGLLTLDGFVEASESRIHVAICGPDPSKLRRSLNESVEFAVDNVAFELDLLF